MDSRIIKRLIGGWVLLELCGCATGRSTSPKCLDISGRWEVIRELCTTEGNTSFGGTATTSIPGQRYALVPSINNDTFWRSGTILEIEQEGCNSLRVKLETPADGPPLPSWHQDLIEIDLHRLKVDLDAIRLKTKSNGIRYEWQLGPIRNDGLHYRWKRRYREFPIGFASYYNEFVCTLPATDRLEPVLH